MSRDLIYIFTKHGKAEMRNSCKTFNLKPHAMRPPVKSGRRR